MSIPFSVRAGTAASSGSPAVQPAPTRPAPRRARARPTTDVLTFTVPHPINEVFANAELLKCVQDGTETRASPIKLGEDTFLSYNGGRIGVWRTPPQQGGSPAYTFHMSEDRRSIERIETRNQGQPAAHLNALEIYGVLSKDFAQWARLQLAQGKTESRTG